MAAALSAALLIGSAAPAHADPVESIAVSVASLFRVPANGQLGYYVELEVQGLWGPTGACPSSANWCGESLQFRTASGSIVTTSEESIPYGWNPWVDEFVGTTPIARVNDVRVRIRGWGGYAYSAWVPVDDDLADPEVNLDVSTFHWNSGAGQAQIVAGVIGTGYGVPEGICPPSSNWCFGYVEGKLASNSSVVTLAYANDYWGQPWPRKHDFSATVNVAELSAIRARLRGSGGDIYGPWISVSPEGISAGHDLAAAGGLIAVAAAGMSSAEGCLTFFLFGPPVPGSSLNQPQAACLSATSGGMSFAAYVRALLPTLSSAQINQLLVASGVAAATAAAAVSPDLDYGHTLPSGCLWATPVSISCSWASGTTTYRPISAPPVLDPVYEDNFLNAATNPWRNPTTDDPISGPLPTPWVGLSGRDVWREALRECERQLNTDNGAGVSVGESLGVEDCLGERIFFTGDNVAEATDHDAEVISADVSTMVLHYKSIAEKGVTKPAWTSIPACAGKTSAQDCDEYPFFATSEGYDGSGQTPDYRPILSANNQAQGGSYGVFVGACFSTQTTLPDTPAREFLVVASRAIPTTFGYCSR